MSLTIEPDEAKIENARALREALRAVMLAYGALDGARRPCGASLSIPHAWALLELARGEPLTVGELASRLNIDRTNVSRLCARLESAGEVGRVPHPTDGRALLVELTPRGREIASSVDRSSVAFFCSVIDALGPDFADLPESLAQLNAALSGARVEEEL